MSKARNAAATKRNNRKISARKFLATPEGKVWLAEKQEEQEEINLARAANNMFYPTDHGAKWFVLLEI